MEICKWEEGVVGVDEKAIQCSSLFLFFFFSIIDSPLFTQVDILTDYCHERMELEQTVTSARKLT